MRPALSLALLSLLLCSGAVIAAQGTCLHDPFAALRAASPLCFSPADDAPQGPLTPHPTSEPPPEPVPAPPAEADDEPGEFLSFEEWKARQIAQGVPTEAAKPASPAAAPLPGGPDGAAPPAAVEVQLAPVPAAAASATASPGAAAAPGIAIPLTDRYNYASDDCSARIHASSSGTKNPSAILSRKKDRYMLHRCDAREKWVELELCDHVWVDTVQLANYEFFSGVFRTVSIYLSPRYPPGPDGWVHAGTFDARNVRGVQSFHPPGSIRGFHRFVRVEFAGQYGGEFWCPVSLLRVYGLNEMEEWKRDAWEAEAEMREREREEREREREREERERERARREGEERERERLVRETRTVEVVVLSTEEPKRAATRDSAAESSTEAAAPPSATGESSAPDPLASAPSSSSSSSEPSSPDAADGPTPHWKSTILPTTTAASPPSSPTVSTTTQTTAGSADATTTTTATEEAPTFALPLGVQMDIFQDGVLRRREEEEVVVAVAVDDAAGSGAEAPGSATDAVPAGSQTAAATPAVEDASRDREPAAASVSASTETSSSSTAAPSADADAGSSTSSTPSPSTSASASTLTTPPQSSASQTHPQSPSYTLSLTPPSPNTNPGESIYRTIMNRLTLLEVNTTLGTRYMEEQSRMMREAFRRLERGVEERWGERRGEEVRRLEGLTAEQRKAFESTVSELENQRERMESERKALVSQIHMLENEVILEKRLSVAQLCILMVVLLVMTLTRGPDWKMLSTAFRPSLTAQAQVQEAGRSRTSSGGSGGGGVKREEDGGDTPGSERAGSAQSQARPRTPVRRSSVPFPPSSPSHLPPLRSPRPLSSHSSLPHRTAPHGISMSSPRRRATGGHLPGTGTGTGTVGAVPGSTKRLARTAHLHELRRVAGKENAAASVILTASTADSNGHFGEAQHVDRRGRERTERSSSGRTGSRTPYVSEKGNGEADDLWEDTDLDEEGRGGRLPSTSRGRAAAAGDVPEGRGRSVDGLRTREVGEVGEVWLDDPPETAPL